MMDKATSRLLQNLAQNIERLERQIKYLEQRVEILEYKTRDIPGRPGISRVTVFIPDGEGKLERLGE